MRWLAVCPLALVTSACVLVKEPLRSGWLLDGVYPQPVPPACNPVVPPGKSAVEITKIVVPATSGEADFEVELPGLGKVTAHLQGASTSSPGVVVSSKAPRPYRVLDARAAMQQVPGFVHRVDLRAYSRIAFVADVSGYMCEGQQDCPEAEIKHGPPAPFLQAQGDQIDAAAAGLRPDQFFVTIAGDATRNMRYVGETWYGRTLAGQFVRGQICSGNRGFRGLLRRALEDTPEVIVLMSDGRPLTDHAYEDKYGGCNAYPDSFHCSIDEKTEQVHLDQLASNKTLPPVIAISVKRQQAKWMMNLAEMTGGVYLDAHP
jgi:hypothetical protein